METHVVKRHDDHYSQHPSDIPDDAKGMKIARTGACDDGKAFEPCVTLLKHSGEDAKSKEYGDGEVIGQDWGHRVHGFH